VLLLLLLKQKAYQHLALFHPALLEHQGVLPLLLLLLLL
jgi:hypothetical protein